MTNTVAIARAIHEAMHSDAASGIRFTGTPWAQLSARERKARMEFAERVVAAMERVDTEVVRG